MSFGMIIRSQNRDKKNDDSEDKKKIKENKKKCSKTKTTKIAKRIMKKH